MKGTIFDIEHGSFVDGPGIRTTVFFKGCNLNCAWCHNPESRSAKPQMMFYKDKCIGCGKCKEICRNGLEKCELCGKCVLYCPKNARKISGKEYSVDELFAEIIADKDFYGADGGVTFSGGECMLQIDFISELLEKCRKEGINTAVDTAGNVPWESFERVLPFTDIFLYDVKLFENGAHEKWTGAGNKLILENLSKLLESKRVWVRIPIIPGVNDTKEEMTKISEFLSLYGMPERVELLPYHRMGESKYEALGQKCVPFAVPDAEKMDSLKKIFNIK